MLYVEVKVNSCPVKATINTGDEVCVMSSACAKRCGIFGLVDKRYAGIARGVGTCKVIGRIHGANFQIGNTTIVWKITIMDMAVGSDLGIGMDLMRRYGTYLDLGKNELRFPFATLKILPDEVVAK